ncbi:hypothetical protein BRADI_2g11515v3 [Brachypodium distachyon]|uniref:Uncharacterized protein n=1 Tax=Brachypodium distachyon TaxID=15368 RepID=A0A0Q3QRJ6_BRADI|nr:hypothetical protein BRADI_2g11515v3 [Brachypodium distachyon]
MDSLVTGRRALPSPQNSCQEAAVVEFRTPEAALNSAPPSSNHLHDTWLRNRPVREPPAGLREDEADGGLPDSGPGLHILADTEFERGTTVVCRARGRWDGARGVVPAHNSTRRATTSPGSSTTGSSTPWNSGWGFGSAFSSRTGREPVPAPRYRIPVTGAHTEFTASQGRSQVVAAWCTCTRV